jgi:hypothetical protein
MAGCGALSAVSGIPGSNHGRQRRKRSEVSAAGSAAVRPQPRGGRGGRTPTASHVRPAGTILVGVSAHRSTRPAAGHHGGRASAPAQPLQMAVVRHVCRTPDRRCGTCVGHPLSAARPADRSVSQAQRPADMTVEAAAEGPQRIRPGGGTGTGCRTPDRGGSPTLPWTGHPVRPQDDLAAHRTGRQKQRTVSPLIAV